MSFRRPWVVLGALLAAAAARADDHRGDLSVAASVAEGSLLTGIHATGTLTMDKYWRVGLLVDFSAHFGDHDGVDVTRVTTLAGLRFLLTGKHTHDANEVPRLNVPFFHVMAGCVDSGLGDEGCVNAAAAGVGVDRFLSKTRAVGIRAQTDLVFTRPFSSERESSFRFSVGIVGRLRHRDHK